MACNVALSSIVARRATVAACKLSTRTVRLHSSESSVSTGLSRLVGEASTWQHAPGHRFRAADKSPIVIEPVAQPDIEDIDMVVFLRISAAT